MVIKIQACTCNSRYVSLLIFLHPNFVETSKLARFFFYVEPVGLDRYSDCDNFSDYTMLIRLLNSVNVFRIVRRPLKN